MDPKPVGLSPRSTTRGRPRLTSGHYTCARCGRSTTRLQARWPEGPVCFTCWFDAIHTHGTCPRCGTERLLPGPPDETGSPVCGPCAGIRCDFQCTRCGEEAGHHRGKLCARCALRDDLTGLVGSPPHGPELLGLIEALCASDRPESIIVWKRSLKVQALLRGLGDGTIPMTHEGLDGVQGKPTEHLRALLQHHGHLPQRDPYLARFEQWIVTKLTGLPDEVRQPVQHFATWHHLRRIRVKAAAGAPTRGPVHSAKQEITEAIKFLVWLHNTYQRTAASCTQSDIDEWLATGPTTRTAIRTFFIVAKRTRLNTKVAVQHRAARTSPSLTQDQRLAWINELLTGTSESLPYRAAGMLLLLYAQPLVKVVTLKLSVVDDHPDGMSILLGQRPTDVPEPFAQLLRDHIAQRPTCEPAPDPTAPGSSPARSLGGTFIPTP
jgi:hypothetical protein